MSDKPSKRLATIVEACDYTKVKRSKLYELINAGEIAAYKRGGKQTLIDLDSVDAMNERNCVPWKQTLRLVV